MTGYEQIARLHKQVEFLKDEIVKCKKISKQQIEKYEVWNKHDVAVISELRKEIKKLKEEQVKR